nr:uncharacterized protein LOC111428834 isoform X2 [Onthophagus taurus]
MANIDRRNYFLSTLIESLIASTPNLTSGYTTRLQQRKKQDVHGGKAQPMMAITRGERATSRPKSVIQQLQQSQQVSRPKTTNVRRPNEAFKSEPTTSSVVHKELYTDNPALVEVTVKTHNIKQRSRSNSVNKREPWSKLLKNEGSYENVSSFTNFDPIRTLHFIAKELHSKLLDSLPNDKSIQQMVIDMQVALSRIPPEVASCVALHLDSPPVNMVQKETSTESLKYAPYYDDIPIQVVKAPTFDKSCQTIRTNYIEADKFQKHLEESSAKIETACKQMENVCTRLKSEKEELEIMLRAEKETVKFLRKQMEECEYEKTEATNTKLITLQQERDSYHLQVKRLKAQIESNQSNSAQELKTVVQELRKQKTLADEQIALLNHNLTLTTMEKEKFVAILSARDRQIKEIRGEMSQLQEVVNEQLADLQNSPSSITSSITNITNDWMNKNKDITQNSDTTVQEPLAHHMYREKEKVFRECPSGDSTMVFKERERKDVHKKMDQPNEIQSNIRDMFAEIKKQALMVTTNHEDEGFRQEQPR